MQKFALTLAVLNFVCAITSLLLKDYAVAINALVVATLMFQIHLEKRNEK